MMPPSFGNYDQSERPKQIKTLMKRLFIIICLLLTTNSPSPAAGVPVFRSASTNSAPRLPLRRDSLVVRAGIYYGDQDEETVAVEANFYLLDASVVEILKAAKFKPEFTDGKKHRATDDDYLAALAAAFASKDDHDDAEAEAVLFLIDDALAKRQKSFVRTDWDGRGFFKTLVPGKYYLFGVGATGGEMIVWNLPVEISPGINSIELDQNNSAGVFPANE